MDDRENLRPLLVEKPFTLSGQQQPPRAVADVHAATAAFLDQTFVNQLLIALQHRQWIEPIISRNRANGGQRITLLQRALENQGYHSIAQLAIDRLVVVPIRVHSSLDVPAVCWGLVAR